MSSEWKMRGEWESEIILVRYVEESGRPDLSGT